jgi:hypothetical protein
MYIQAANFIRKLCDWSSVVTPNFEKLRGVSVGVLCQNLLIHQVCFFFKKEYPIKCVRSVLCLDQCSQFVAPTNCTVLTVYKYSTSCTLYLCT